MRQATGEKERGLGPVCYIVGAGDRTEDILCPAADDLVIAADGGYCWLKDMGIQPHLLVGDFDSLPRHPDGPDIVSLPREKNDTDTMAAVRLAMERGYRRFRLYGGTGGRFDHTMANVQLLTWLARRGCENRLIARGWVAAAVTDSALEFPSGAEGMVSVFCQGDRAEGVSIEGLKYPLTDTILTCEFALGVSNEFTGEASRISVKEGTLLIIWERT